MTNNFGTASRRSWVAVAVVLALTTGCATRAPAIRYFTFPPAAVLPSATASSPVQRLAVGPVHVAAYLDHEQLVTRNGAAVTLHDTARWAAPLNESVTEYLIAAVARRMPDTAVAAFPDSVGFTFDRRVVVDIVRFDGAPGANAELVARWRLLEATGRVPGAEFRYEEIIAVAGGTLADLVGAQGALLEGLADRIVAALAAGTAR